MLLRTCLVLGKTNSLSSHTDARGTHGWSCGERVPDPCAPLASVCAAENVSALETGKPLSPSELAQRKSRDLVSIWVSS